MAHRPISSVNVVANIHISSHIFYMCVYVCVCVYLYTHKVVNLDFSFRKWEVLMMSSSCWGHNKDKGIHWLICSQLFLLFAWALTDLLSAFPFLCLCHMPHVVKERAKQLCWDGRHLSHAEIIFSEWHDGKGLLFCFRMSLSKKHILNPVKYKNLYVQSWLQSLIKEGESSTVKSHK